MNAHDSDRMAEVLEAHGWTTAASVDEADLVVLNTCSVREKAEQKLRSEVGKLARYKEAKRGGMVLAVAGCVAQQEGEKLLARVKHLDLVVGPDNLAELPRLVADQIAGAPPRAHTVFDVDTPRFLAAAPAPGAAPVSAFITTMKGCDERCSFCIVPYTRGPERYRPAGEILAEAERWVAAGAREITLLGQTVDSYRDASLPPPASDDPDESQFPSLLRLLARVPGLRRVRYTSPHPRHLTPALVDAHRELDVLARHVHMPVQSGSDRMLKRMIRRYTRAEYTERVRRLQGARPDLTVSTDVIVGFPGETEADFRQTLELVEEIGFTGLFGFKYSPRPFTPALKLTDDVTEEEKSERLARLFELSEALGKAHLARLVGTTASVLVEGRGKTGAWEGRTDRNEIVHVDAGDERDLSGEVVAVTITDAFKHSLAGEPTAEALRALPAPGPHVIRPLRRRLPLV
ncbi:MAG: tRNA (N6-isopentenyl adenosine(37)-C2)-methylthiotransferase MiaB [Labilithrix sp.]|nr:tRNA (N6-isopentenyl adenosine(37)-C2)-methylthiotransferase MiaB [Labilithrix sp.]MCW5814555.1 tRNA (N6-isopentenyl adenosine(37)-C2)-methylthiotransferase MiaB [Labilithrix sp.]